MVLPIGNPYPTGEKNPVEAVLDAALPAAGAWVVGPEITAAIFDQITLFADYIRGAAGGAVDLRLEYSPYSVDQVGVDNWFQMSIYSAGAMAAGTDIQSFIQREYITYTSTGATSEAFIYGPLSLMQTVERVRISARESGVVGTPGTIHVVAVLNAE